MASTLPEQEAEQVGDVAVDRAEQEDAEGERAREQDADRGVLAEPAPRVTKPMASAVATAAIAAPR